MSERVLCAVPVNERRGFRWPAPYALVVTDRRAILVPFARDTLKRAGIEARERAREAGQGLLDRWRARIQAMNDYAAPFASMSPALIERYPGAESIEHAVVAVAKLAETSDGDSSSTTWTLRLTLPDRKRTFDLRALPGGLAAALRQAYGQRFRG